MLEGLRVQKLTEGTTVVAHAFNPSTQEAEAVDLCEFKANMVYKS